MSTPLPDPLVAASAPISAYMSGHESANLAYVQYFGKKKDAVSATFKSLNSQGFLCSYKTAADGDEEHEVFIEYNAPVHKREDVRIVLEAMAKEAEKELGMPSSMNGPPPIKAMMRAAEIENAQRIELEHLNDNLEAEQANAASGNVFGTSSTVPLNVFYPADRHWQITVAVALGTNALLGYASPHFLSRMFPSFVLSFRDYLTPGLIRSMFKFAVILHAAEGSVALGICLERGWYSPLNTAKWTVSTTLYGIASLSKLLTHGKMVDKSISRKGL